MCVSCVKQSGSDAGKIVYSGTCQRTKKDLAGPDLRQSWATRAAQCDDQAQRMHMTKQDDSILDAARGKVLQ